MKKISFLLVLFILINGNFSAGQEQAGKSRKEVRKEKESKLAEKTRQLIELRKYVFKADQAHPMGGGVIHLTSPYDLKVTGDSAIAWLPYYGVAYRVEYGSLEGGIKFSEPFNDYQVHSKKSVHEVTFEVKDPKDIYIVRLTFSDSGYGTLGVTSNNRQFISFSGRVEPIQK